MKKRFSLHGMRDFLIMWGSQSFSSLGSSMTSFALILWVYQQEGTATSIALLSLFTYLPSTLFCFISGTLVDGWDKKRVILTCNVIAAAGTAAVLILYGAGALEIWHLYLVNLLLSAASAFQNPASSVAESLVVPREQYVRASGFQTFASSATLILGPALATAILALSGLRVVLRFDLFSFAVPFFAVWLFIKLPAIPRRAETQSFLRSCTAGLRFLREHRALLYLILFFAFVNLISYMTGFGIQPAMILARTGNNQAALAAVTSAAGVGSIVGSVLVTVLKPAKRRVTTVFLSCAISFAVCNPVLAVGRTAPLWAVAAFAGNLPLPFLTANMTTLMRTHVPVEMQGRVFSARNTLQFSTIPLGLFLGGFLADRVFEPFMRSPSQVQGFLSRLVGGGQGSGMAAMFLMTGVIGCAASLACLRSRAYAELDR